MANCPDDPAQPAADTPPGSPTQLPVLTRSLCDLRVALSYLRGLDLVCRKIVTKQNACVSQISTLSSEPTSATCLLQLEAAMDIATCIIILLTLGVGQGEAIEIQADGPMRSRRWKH